MKIKNVVTALLIATIVVNTQANAFSLSGTAKQFQNILQQVGFQIETYKCGYEAQMQSRTVYVCTDTFPSKEKLAKLEKILKKNKFVMSPLSSLNEYDIDDGLLVFTDKKEDMSYIFMIDSTLGIVYIIGK